MTSITHGVPLAPPATAPLTPGVSPVVPAAAATLAAAEAEILPFAQALAPAPAPVPAADPAPDGAAMRPDQVFMARQLAWPTPDGAALASSWRAMVRTYGSQLAAREQQARASRLPAALLAAAQDGRTLRPGDGELAPADAWRFTVHADGPQARRLAVIAQEADQPPGRRRRARAALRLDLELADGTRVVVQAEPLPGGIALELCAPGARALARLRELQGELEEAVARAGLRVLRWRFRDSLPAGQSHAQLAASEAAMALSLPVFRAVAELALLLPAV